MFMNLLTFLTLFIVTAFLTGCSSEPKPFNHEDLKIFGTQDFSKESWNTADRHERGAMLYDLFETHDFIGQPVESVDALLGQHTSYYIHDSYPAYKVGPINVYSEHGIGYIIAFITDPKTGLIVKYDLAPKLSKSNFGL